MRTEGRRDLARAVTELSRRGARVLVVAATLAAACIPDDGPLMRPGENCLECHGGAMLPDEPPSVADREGAERRWTIAGTVFPSVSAAPGDGVRGAKVHVRDANGKTFTLETNRAGNFYTAERVTFPLRVAVEHRGVTHEMEPDVPYGGCNGCHRIPPRRDAPGRISVTGDGLDEGPLMLPGENCLECHGGTVLPGEPPTIPVPRTAPRWTVAGTVFPSVGAAAAEGVRGARVHLTDALGTTLTLETNEAGNFYTDAPLRFPLRARVEHAGVVQEMEPDVPYGGCNGCHRVPPRQDAPGRISVTGDGLDEGPLMLPGENCLECHGRTIFPGEPPTIAVPRTAPTWTAAGTVFATEDGGAAVTGARVHLTDALGATVVLETNEVGNFYTDAPLRFPLRARVEYGGLVHEMEPDVVYGGCNGCHRLPPRQEAPGRVTIPGAGD